MLYGSAAMMPACCAKSIAVALLLTVSITDSGPVVAGSMVGEHSEKQPATDLASLFKQVSPSVVTITTLNALGGNLAQGSGFFIAEDRIATNHHVIEGASAAVVRLSTGVELKVEGILADNPALDLAILQVKRPDNPPPRLKLQTTLPDVGERVVAISTPQGYELSISDGIVAGVRNEDPFGTVLQTTAATSPGSSGGPLLNLKGEVVGVHCYADRRGTLLQFAIAASSLDALKLGQLRPLELSLPPLGSKPPDVPEAFLRGVPDSQLKAISTACQWYVRLPDGSCVNAYRTLRTWQLVNSNNSGAARELEALDFKRADEDGDYVLKHENLPQWADTSKDRLILPALPGYQLLRVVEAPAKATGICDLTPGIAASDCPALLVVRGGWRDDPTPGSVIREPAMLFRNGDFTFQGRTIPLYTIVFLEDARPTPAQLAFHLVSSQAPLLVHRFDRTDVQPTRVVETRAGNTIYRRNVPSGSPVRTYKWAVNTVPIRYKDPNLLPPPTLAKKPSPGITTTSAPAEDAPDTLTLKDGRVLAGRVVKEAAAEIEFRVVVNGIEATITVPRGEVVSLAHKSPSTE